MSCSLFNRVLSVYYVILVISHFGFEDRILNLTAPVPGHFFKFYESEIILQVIKYGK